MEILLPGERYINDTNLSANPVVYALRIPEFSEVVLETLFMCRSHVAGESLPTNLGTQTKQIIKKTIKKI